jgi:cytoskeleton protein RodZ
VENKGQDTATNGSINLTGPAPASTPAADEKNAAATPANLSTPATPLPIPQPNATTPAVPPATVAPTPPAALAVKETPAPSDKPHLVVRAEQESWVLIVDGKGNTVLDRVLKPKETFDIPAQKGLKLTTGNAGGIILNQNKVDLPPLGAISQVIRGMSLDPEKLTH